MSELAKRILDLQRELHGYYVSQWNDVMALWVLRASGSRTKFVMKLESGERQRLIEIMEDELEYVKNPRVDDPWDGPWGE